MAKWFFYPLWLLLPLVFLVGCGPADSDAEAPLAEEAPAAREQTAAVIPTRAPKSAGGAPRSQPVDDLMAANFAPDGPGAAVIVIQDGKIVHMAGYGLADVERRTPITPQTIFHMGSTAKQMTGVAVMMLAEAGKLNYDAPVGQYLPELARFGSDLTIRRLLNHTSGIPDYDENDQLEDQLLARANRPSSADLVAVLANEGDLRYMPGEKFAYSNAGYDVLGALIERLSGKSFPEFMQERIFGPLNMQSTFSQPNPGRLSDPNLAHSYTRQGGEVVAEDESPLDYLVGSGSVYASVADLYYYDQALYGDQLVKQSTLAEAFKPARLNDGSLSDYGFGWELKTRAGKPYYTHDGSWLGFVSSYVRFPDQHLSVIILVNRDYDLPEDDLELKIAELYLK